MKTLFSTTILTLLMLVLFVGVYNLTLTSIAQVLPTAGKPQTVQVKGKTVGYANIGQKFDKPIYFWGRPSAVAYNASGSGGSNKAISNTDYMKEVQARIDTFLKAHLYLQKKDLPAELVTASGSGLDPHISPTSALVQARRIAQARKISEQKIIDLVHKHTEKPLSGLLGVPVVNVLALNVALDNL